MQDRKIILNDNLGNNIHDDVYFNDNKPVLGRVKIYQHNVGDTKLFLLHDTNNLVVYRGRRYLSRRAFNINASTDSQDFKNLFISWLAVGKGGAIGNNPLIPTAPHIANSVLSSQGTIDSGVNYVVVNSKQYHKFDTGYPTFITDGQIMDNSVAQPGDNELVVKVKVTIGADEANGDGGVFDPDAYQDINELGLFLSDKNTISPAPTVMELFSRVTFPTIRKTSQFRLTVEWLLYF